MPDLTFTTALAWFGILASAASVGSLVHGWISSRHTTRLQSDIHAATQATLLDLGKGFRETQHQLGQILDRMDTRWQEAFERMDRAAEQRHQDLKDRLDGREG